MKSCRFVMVGFLFFQTDEAGNDEVSKALAVHPVVSVEDRRMKYSIKSLLGKRKSETTEMVNV